MKEISEKVKEDLIDALSTIHWYKKNLRGYMIKITDNYNYLYNLDWGNRSKWEICEDYINRLAENNEINQVVKIIECIFTMNLEHLAKLENGKTKMETAEKNIEKLKESSKYIFSKTEEVRQKDYENREYKNNIFDGKLKKIKEFYSQIIEETPQKRGYELEKIIYKLFDLYNLAPEKPYRIKGEQIDGYFELDGTGFIVEIKWTKDLTTRGEIDIFDAKIGRKMKSTLGLFISVAGYNSTALEIYKNSGTSVIFLDGDDISYVLSGKVDFRKLIKAKKRYSEQTGDPYLKTADMLDIV